MVSKLAVILVIALCLGHLAALPLELNDSNFYTEIKEYRLALVLFHAPWCDHSAYLLPEFEAAAEIIAGDIPKITFITIDAIENDAVAGAEILQGFPTLKIYIKGTFYETYTGSWDAVGLVKTMRWYNKPVSKRLSSAAEAEEWIASSTDTSVLGTFHGLKDDAFDLLAKDLSSEYRFAYISAFELPGLQSVSKGSSIIGVARGTRLSEMDENLQLLQFASDH